MYSLSYANSCRSYSQSSSIIATGASDAVEFTRTLGSELLRDTMNISVASSTLSSIVEMLTHTGWSGTDGSTMCCSAITGVKPPAKAAEIKNSMLSTQVEFHPDKQLGNEINFN